MKFHIVSSTELVFPMNLTLTVKKFQELTTKIRLIELVDERGSTLPSFTAGAHIDVDTGTTGIRSYSLISWSQPSPSPKSYYIAVQREDDGEGGSAFMHRLSVEQSLSVTEPKNDFELSNRRAPAVLIAGGIGVTPIISMAATLHDQARPFHCHYTGRSRSLMGLVDEMETHLGSSLSIYSDDESPLDLDKLIRDCDPASHFYICGPKGMIEAVRTKAITAGFTLEQIHIELFSTPQTESDDQPFEVEVNSTGQVYVVPVGKTIIDVLDAEGIDLTFDCQRGDCGICQTDVISGTPDHRDLVLSDVERDSGKIMQICVSRAKSARLVLDI